MTQLHITTPVLLHRQFSALLNKTVWLKMDRLQPSGSFQLRGIGRRCQRAAALVMVYQNLAVLKEFKHPLIGVCGGIAVDMVKLEAWKTQFKLS